MQFRLSYLYPGLVKGFSGSDFETLKKYKYLGRLIIVDTDSLHALLLEEQMYHRNQECRGLTAAGLRARHDVPSRHDIGQRMLLHRRRLLILGPHHVLQQYRMEIGTLE